MLNDTGQNAPHFGREQKILLMKKIIVAGFILSICYHVYLGVYLGLAWPYNTPLFSPKNMFMDFFNSYHHVVDRAPYALPPDATRCHLPFTQLVQYIFDYATPYHASALSFVIFLTMFTTYFLWFCLQNLENTNVTETRKNVFIFSFLTYPFLFAIDRGHIEGILFIYLCLFVFFYRGKEFGKSAFLLSLTIAMKPYNLVFLVLLLSDKKYKEIAKTVFFAFALNLTSLLIFKGDIVTNLQNMLVNIKLNHEIYSIGDWGTAYSHTIYNAAKIYFIHLYGYSQEIYFAKVLQFSKVYFFITVFLFSLISFYILRIEKEFWKKITLLTITMLILPYGSPDIRLILLYIPLFLFINSTDKNNKMNIVYTILFALLLVPKDYWHFDPMPVISSSVILNPLIMIILSVLIVIDGLNNRNKLITV